MFVFQDLTAHCREIGNETIAIIGGQLNKWLLNRNAEKWKPPKMLTIPRAVEKTELSTILEERGLGSNKWKKTRNVHVLDLDYDQAKDVFGLDMILRNVTEDNTAPYSLTITHCRITWRKKMTMNNLKLEAFIHKQYFEL